MLNTKQRAQLRALANPLAVTLIIGKEGVTEAVERELDALLESHELVKGKVLESAMLTPRTVSEALCEATGADAVQCIGSKFVVYRQSSDEDKRRIEGIGPAPFAIRLPESFDLGVVIFFPSSLVSSVMISVPSPCLRSPA